jgi:tRNA A-37 threonylcarbamoyl transferase component Bud32
MELVKGQSLRERLEKGPLDPQLAVRLMAEVADALVAAHRRGVIHRDAYTFSILCFDVRYMAIQRRRNRDDIFTAAIGSSG